MGGKPGKCHPIRCVIVVKRSRRMKPRLDHGFAIQEYLRTLMSRISGRVVQTTDWNELSTEREIRKMVTVNIDFFFFSERYKRKQRPRAVELGQCFKGRVFKKWEIL